MRDPARHPCLAPDHQNLANRIAGLRACSAGWALLDLVYTTLENGPVLRALGDITWREAQTAATRIVPRDTIAV